MIGAVVLSHGGHDGEALRPRLGPGSDGASGPALHELDVPDVLRPGDGLRRVPAALPRLRIRLHIVQRLESHIRRCENASR